jgi:hypothetical protein
VNGERHELIKLHGRIGITKEGIEEIIQQANDVFEKDSKYTTLAVRIYFNMVPLKIVHGVHLKTAEKSTGSRTKLPVYRQHSNAFLNNLQKAIQG